MSSVMAIDTEAARKAILDIVADAVATAGPQGVPSGHLYSMLMPYGCTIGAYHNLIAALRADGRIVVKGDLITAAKGKTNA